MLAQKYEEPCGGDTASDQSGRPDDLEQRLTDSWLDQKGDNVLPHRSAFEPFEIVDLLPRIAIVECDHTNDDFVYRLTGTELDRHMNRSLTGKAVSEIAHQKAPSPFWDLLRQVKTSGEPASVTLSFVGSPFDLRELQVIALPYTMKGDDVDQMVLGFTFISSGLV